MADLLFKCSGCATSLAVEDASVGQAIECPGCKQRVLVPQPGCVFRCSKCQGQLLAPAGMSGQLLNCPNCDSGITVPPPSKKRIVIQTATPLTAPSPVPPPAGRKCPYCGGGVAPAAIVCVNCGINLRTGQKYGASQPTTPTPSDSTAVIVSVTILGILLVGGGVWFWLSTQRSQFDQAEGVRRHQAEEQKVEQQPVATAVDTKKERYLQLLRPLLADYVKLRGGLDRGIAYAELSSLLGQAEADYTIASTASEAKGFPEFNLVFVEGPRSPLTFLGKLCRRLNGNEMFKEMVPLDDPLAKHMLNVYPSLGKATLEPTATSRGALFVKDAIPIMMAEASKSLTAAIDAHAAFSR